MVSMCSSSIPDVCTSDDDTLHDGRAACHDHWSACASRFRRCCPCGVYLFFVAEHFDLFFALVVQVVLAPPDPPPRGSVAVFLVCVAFRGVFFVSLCVWSRLSLHHAILARGRASHHSLREQCRR